MKKKIVALLLCVAMLAIAIVGGTLAYFTDAEAATNTFAVGNIDITLTEEVLVTDASGNALPYRAELIAEGARYQNLMPTNKIVKKPTVTNVSTNGNVAYVRVVVTMNNAYELNKAIDDVYEVAGYDPADVQAVYDEVFEGWSINYNPRPAAHGADDARGIIEDLTKMANYDANKVIAVDFTKTINPGHHIFGLKNWFQNDAEKQAAIDNGAYDKYEVVASGDYQGYYTNGMNEGEIRYVFYLKLNAGESYTVFNGLNIPADFDNNATDKNGNPVNQMAFFDGLIINIKADAIQAEGFATAEEAFAALQKAHPIG